jgi:alkyl sulfatase BDS1-like metallo-beta-lactamase superfamily hydrolase
LGRRERGVSDRPTGRQVKIIAGGVSGRGVGENIFAGNAMIRRAH